MVYISVQCHLEMSLFPTVLEFGDGNGTPLLYSCLENPMDRGAWWAAVHWVAKSRTWLSDFTFTFHFHSLEREMATHSSVLAWRIPGMGEPGGLPSMGSHRVRHDWSDLAAAAAVLELRNSLTPTSPLPHIMDICSGLHCVPPKFICWRPNPQHLRKWLYLEMVPLTRWLSSKEAIGVDPKPNWCPDWCQDA